MKYFSGQRVAVPGGAGFVGSHLVPRLKELGAEVFVPKLEDGFDFRKKDICAKYFADTKPGIVINCAANQGGIGYHSGRQADMFMDNMQMGTYLMEAAREEGVKKFVNLVAGCSYPGYLEKDELNEEDYWNGAIHESIFSYGFPRKASVVYGLALKKQYGFDSIHLVMANLYGPGEHFNPDQSKALAGLMKKFYEAKKNNAPSVEVWGSGKPIRDWMYVKDAVEGMLHAAEVYDEVEPLNLASGVGVSVRELAEMIKNITGYGGELVYNTAKPDGALKKMFGVKKMKEKLDWMPQTPLEEGIKETLAWLDANYEYAIAH